MQPDDRRTTFERGSEPRAAAVGTVVAHASLMAGPYGVCAPSASPIVQQHLPEETLATPGRPARSVDVLVDARTATNPFFKAQSHDPHIGNCHAGASIRALSYSPIGTLRDDPDYLSCQLQRFVRGQGVRAAQLEIGRLRDGIEAFRSLGGDPARAQVFERIASHLEAALEPLAADRERFVAEMRPKALAYASDVLSTAEARMHAVRDQYGLVRLVGKDGPFFAATDRAAVEDLSLAAQAIWSDLEAVHATEKALFGRDASGRPHYLAMGMTETQARAHVAAKEHALERTLEAAANAHPILASLAKSGSLEDVLDGLAAGRVEVIATTMFDALEDIAATRAMLADDPARVWQLPRVIEGAIAAEDIDTRSMGASYARDMVRTSAQDRRFLDHAIAATSIGLGTMAMLTPAGWGLIALTAAATAVDAAQAYRSVQNYRLHDAAAGIDPDPDRALATAPTTIWVAIDVAAAAAGAAGVAKGLTQSPFVRAMAANPIFAKTGEKIAAEIGSDAAAKIFDAIGMNAFERLGRDMSGEAMVALINGRDAAAVRFVAEGLDAADAARMLRNVDDEALGVLCGSLSAEQVALAEAELGSDLVEALAKTAGGELVGALHRALGPRAVGAIAVEGTDVVIHGLTRMKPEAMLEIARRDSEMLARIVDGIGTLAQKPPALREAVERIAEHVPRLLEKVEPAQLIGIGQRFEAATLSRLADASGAEILTLASIRPRDAVAKLAEAGAQGAEILAMERILGKEAGAKLGALHARCAPGELRALLDEHGATGVAGQIDALIEARSVAKAAPGEAAGISTAAAKSAGLSNAMLRRLDDIQKSVDVLSTEERAVFEAAVAAVRRGEAVDTRRLDVLKEIAKRLAPVDIELKSIGRAHELPKPLVGEDAVVVDTQMVIGRHATAKSTGTAADGAMGKELDRLLTRQDVRVADATAGHEARGIVPKEVSGIEVSVARTSEEYRRLYRVLARYKVGRRTGSVDREIVADVFFARTNPGVIPTLVTGDRPIWQRLATIAKTDPSAVVDLTGRTPFFVTIDGRTIRVVPFVP